jgi:cation diffusion facilitator CzcD-associated flavoprotein CzcO
MIEVPVLVVGGGPVGLTTALALQKRNIRTLVVERNPTTRTPPGTCSRFSPLRVDLNPCAWTGGKEGVKARNWAHSARHTAAWSTELLPNLRPELRSLLYSLF